MQYIYVDGNQNPRIDLEKLSRDNFGYNIFYIKRTNLTGPSVTIVSNSGIDGSNSYVLSIPFMAAHLHRDPLGHWWIH